MTQMTATTSVPKLRKVLIANRGEIAVRVIRACASYGLKSVAVYADSDANALHVRLADEAYALNGRTALETYLDIDKLVDVALTCGADAVHPGYGFLSERADFAQAVEDAGLTWIGPTPQNMELLGDKVAARAIARKVGAPLVPGTPGPVESVDEIWDFANQYGFPIAIKAAFGGGGRGLKVVYGPDELEAGFQQATSEALSAFGRGECYAEKFVQRPRHVEAQILGDGRGRVVVVGTRDCSLQRRHQKVLEEAPAPFLTDSQFTELVEAARAIGEEVKYRGVGTLEFMLGDDGALSFLEVNTRLQVEHPVTERTTGLDLVVEQFKVAEGGTLDHLPDVVPAYGHAIEFRINAEDPGRGFFPMPGHLTRFDMPGGPFLRVDAGVTSNGSISPEFDSMIAKVIVWGVDRDEAIGRGRQAMRECVIEGVPSLVGFHRRILQEPGFAAKTAEEFTIHTNWIETECTWLDSLVQPYPAGFASTDVVRTWFEVDGRWVRLGFPAALLSSLRRSSASAPEVSDQLHGAVWATMSGVVSRWFVALGDEVEEGMRLGTLEAMKMEVPIVADHAGLFAYLVEEGSIVQEGQPLALVG
ncbi:MAG: ATP-grasp domain-containing protein [Propionibacteriaceae bacterium]|nr:ATP-grasp domain-containing protein [Propionibacteriaceae bacterium]